MSFPPPTPRQARIIWFALTALAVAVTVGMVGTIFWALGRVVMTLSAVLWPIAVAGVFAIILDPVVEALRHRGVPRLRAILLVFGGAALLLLGMLGSLIPRLVVEAGDLADRVPLYVEKGRDRIESFLKNPPAPLVSALPLSWKERLKNLGGAESTNVASRSQDGANDPALRGGDRAAGIPREEPGTGTPGAGASGAAAGPVGGPPAWLERLMDPDALKDASGWLGALAAEVGGWFVGQMGRVASWLGILAGLALIPVYAFYFLLERSTIEKRWTDYLPVSDSRFKDELVWLLRNINDALVVFFRGQVLVAVCDGVLYGIGFLAIGLPYALLLGVLAMGLTIVPFLGAIVTCGSALAIAIIQFGDWQHPVLVLAVFMVVQTIEGWVIQPKIIGDRVGLHPVTIIVALMVGTTLMGGLLGGLLAIPATAVLRALMFRYVWRARERTGGGGESVGEEEKPLTV